MCWTSGRDRWFCSELIAKRRSSSDSTPRPNISCIQLHCSALLSGTTVCAENAQSIVQTIFTLLSAARKVFVCLICRGWYDYTVPRICLRDFSLNATYHLHFHGCMLMNTYSEWSRDFRFLCATSTMSTVLQMWASAKIHNLKFPWNCSWWVTYDSRGLLLCASIYTVNAFSL